MNWMTLFFAGWPGVIRAVISGGLAYVALVISLRVSGKRTLSKRQAHVIEEERLRSGRHRCAGFDFGDHHAVQRCCAR